MYRKELAVALSAAHKAGVLISEVYKTLKPYENAPADLTTETDKQSQEIILKVLREEFPSDSLCAEEKTLTLSESPLGASRTWVVDPIDGTRGFAMKNDQFSVMVAMMDQGKVVVGVVHEPATGKTTYAAKGQGCFLMQHGKETIACKVRTCVDLSKAILVQSHAKPGKTSKAEAAFSPGSLLETYSAGLKMAIVARGEGDLYANNYPAFHDWDICAGHILVEEAGGKLTDFSGNPVVYGAPGFKQTKGMLATNGYLHSAALAKAVGLLES
ncbi:MAG: 3'(2'),5'-bisphosphate nucleotidase CysQ [Planctomycetota bacterium]|nr:MAG: 3'(2'),5'-bisphosphate nucleotidase CysQ [Planctomycetota bacterium]RLS90915.1 MAG: 3'(2'),5'-bisphosphate nucleotidase CysQ [Planctomycetota bacterium]